MPAYKLGMLGKLYYKVGGQSGGGSYIELTNVRDVTLNLEAGESDLTTRANAGWRAMVPTLRTGGVDFEMVWDPADAGFVAVKNAFLTNAIIAFKVLDAAEGTGKGLQADFMISNFSRAEPLEEGMTVSVTAKIAQSNDAPVWVE